MKKMYSEGFSDPMEFMGFFKIYSISRQPYKNRPFFSRVTWPQDCDKSSFFQILSLWKKKPKPQLKGSGHK